MWASLSFILALGEELPFVDVEGEAESVEESELLVDRQNVHDEVSNLSIKIQILKGEETIRKLILIKSILAPIPAPRS